MARYWLARRWWSSTADAFEPRIRELLHATPAIPATVIAERIEWPYSIRTLSTTVPRLRRYYLPADPSSRTSYEPGEVAQCDFWFPDIRLRAEQTNMRLADSRERLAKMLAGAVAENTFTILVDYLQPAFAPALEAATQDAKLLVGVGPMPDVGQLSRAGMTVMDAYLTMDGHRTRHGAIRAARASLSRQGLRPERDDASLFAELKEPQRLYDIKNWRLDMAKPWPDDAHARFVWLMINAAEQLWLPTPAEQDNAWLEVFGEDLERTQQGVHPMAGWRVLLSR